VLVGIVLRGELLWVPRVDLRPSAFLAVNQTRAALGVNAPVS
jgi:hypothetical protein